MIRCFAKCIFHVMDWPLDRRYSHEINKKIIIVAPQTSTMVFPIGLRVKYWVNLEVIFYVKLELIKGITGCFLRSIGGRAVDRSKNNNFAGQDVADFKNIESYTMVTGPEGMRKKVLKSGFYYIALQAKVPIIPVAFDYVKTAIKFFPASYRVEGREEQEIEDLQMLFKDITGKIPEYSVN